MAGWLKVRKDLPEDPKTIAVAGAIGLSIDETMGKLIRLWAWADDHARDPDPSRVTSRVTQRDARVMRHGDAVTPFVTATWVDGFVGVTGFAAALVKVGWLDTTPTGLRFVNFREHNWKQEHQKALAAERSRRYREKRREDPPARDVTSPSRARERDITRPPDLTSSRGMNSPSTPSCPETAPAVTRAGVLTFPTDGKEKSWELTEALLAEWRAAYPSLDVLAECKKALAWVNAAPDRRKTARGMPRFLVGWLGRSQDRGGGRRAAPPADRPDFDTLFSRAKETQCPGTSGPGGISPSSG
jgi:hypothetical protein